MGRLIAIETALFLTPFVIFALYVVLRRRVTDFALVRAEMPLAVLATGGFLLVAASLLVFAAFHQGNATGTYVPDRFENGRLVPGRIQ